MGDKDHAAMTAMGKVLASGVRAGKIDEAAVKAKAAELEQQAETRRAAVGKALDTLHATLTPAQREALVAKVEEHMQDHPPFAGPNGKGRGPEGRGPEGEGRGPEGRGPEGRGPEGEGRGPERMGRGPHGPLGFLLHDLELSDAQREKIHAGLEAARPAKPTREEMQKKHEEMRTRQKAVLDAFRGAKFDGAAALPDKPAGEPPVVHLAEALDVIVPVLDANQREALAKRLEEGPPRMDMGGRKHGRHGGPEGKPER
jgi:Spy/CpxP family protein refolding chaperone